MAPKFIKSVLRSLELLKCYNVVTTTNADAPYHVPCTYARVDTFFCHVPGKQFFINISRHANMTRFGREVYWHYECYYHIPEDVDARDVLWHDKWGGSRFSGIINTRNDGLPYLYKEIPTFISGIEKKIAAGINEVLDGLWYDPEEFHEAPFIISSDHNSSFNRDNTDAMIYSFLKQFDVRAYRALLSPNSTMYWSYSHHEAKCSDRGYLNRGGIIDPQYVNWWDNKWHITHPLMTRI